jgi:iron complex transport system permease protein
LGVALYLSVFGGSLWAMQVWMGLGMTGAAFVGAVLAVMLTLALVRGVQQTLRLLLAGVVVGVVLGALTSLLSLLQPQVLQAMQGFMLGSTAFVSWAACGVLAAVLLPCLLLSAVFARVLDALTLGEATAQSLGVPLRSARLALVGVLSLATGAAVAHIGLVAFVGLAAPHLVRSLVRTTHAGSLLLSAGLLLVLADVWARVLFAPQELPVGVLTAVIGGGYLLWRVYRVSESGGRA